MLLTELGAQEEARRVQSRDLFVVARVDYYGVVGVMHRDELNAWFDELGVPRERCIPQFVITQSRGDGSYRLHVSAHVLGENGRPFIDHAADGVVSEPLVYVVESVPSWLKGVTR